MSVVMFGKKKRSFNLLVPLIPASELKRVDEGLPDERLSVIPRNVWQLGIGEIFFFKVGLKYHGHLRESDILSKIDRTGQFGPPFLTSRLVGVVVWGTNDPMLDGFSLRIY
ncbi:hypothetical protein K449DRAFT_435091 [Hypoxylon sp. EC38]|nr:hypothetical protein K449DRAFT_435091 [Hypoxylon sp. EC38]